MGYLTWLITKHRYAASAHTMRVKGSVHLYNMGDSCGGFASSWEPRYNCNNTRVGVLFRGIMGDHSERSPHLGQGERNG